MALLARTTPTLRAIAGVSSARTCSNLLTALPGLARLIDRTRYGSFIVKPHRYAAVPSV
jgi:hypothetical protein